jgi:Transcriptional regulator
MKTLDPKRLLELLCISRHGSYTKAAAVLGVSQPALSNSITLLERTVGGPVLMRTRQGVGLTELGEMLVSHAAALDAALTRANDELDLKKQGIAGSLVIGLSPTATVDLVPDAVVRMTAESPNVVVTIHERPCDELQARLQTGEIDVVISPTGLAKDPAEIEREVLFHESFAVVMRPQHPLAQCKSLALRDLSSERWVMPNPQTVLWQQLEALFTAENEPWPANVVSTNSISLRKSLMMRGDFVSVSPTRVVQREAAAHYLSCIPLRNSHFAREVCMRYRSASERSPVIARFKTILRELADASSFSGQIKTSFADPHRQRATRASALVAVRSN